MKSRNLSDSANMQVLDRHFDKLMKDNTILTIIGNRTFFNYNYIGRNRKINDKDVN